MRLNSEAFRRIERLTGYPRVEYWGAIPDPERPGAHILKIGATDGPDPTYAAVYWIRDDFTVHSIEDFVVIGEGTRTVIPRRPYDAIDL